jgi:8-amino-7-oxononanoate synthase
VPERSARLRFFISCEHTQSEIDEAVAAIVEERARLDRAGAGS